MSTRSALVLSPDPYLAFLLERHPEGLHVTVGDRDVRISSIIAAATDIVVCEHDDPRLGDLRRALGDRVIAVADPGVTRHDPRVIHRPLSAEEVQRALDLPQAHRPRLLEDPIGALGQLYPWGLVLAGLVAVAVAHLRPTELPILLAAYAATAYGLARTRIRHAAWTLLDLVAAGTAAVADGGVRGGFIAFSLVAAAGLGLHLPTALVVAGSLALGIANAVGTELLTIGRTDLTFAVQTTLMFPLFALLAATGSERARTSEAGTQHRLTTLLRELRVLASSDPGALRLSEVSRHALSSVLGAADASAGILLLAWESGLEIGAAEGIELDRAEAVDWPGQHRPFDQRVTSVDREALPESLAGGFGTEQVTLIVVTDQELLQGLVIVPGTLGRRARSRAETAARLAGARVANARSFARLR
ncbi:MAG TPA: hypothetical protein VGA69_12985, partial [Nitriliruptorales bacterium]